MIGAGFSRNADARVASAQSFPLWFDMVALLVDKLYPQHHYAESFRNDVVNGAVATSGALRLAEEFEAAFGRQRLDELISSSIPDEQHNPGKIHRLLLEMPWSDILTTNYDTLLERTRQDVVDRRYDVVRTIDDIPHSQRPRIVKLHGSLPSHRPFVFTEEDFRKYPTGSSAFVNLAQQAIMENVVCLLGFSGDDPNFLYWTGWVRDNLGYSSPRIYLCGLLDLTESQRLLLYRRNVTPIDLSPLFSEDEYPVPNIRHRSATEWFLLSLEAGRPPDPLSWPNSPETYTVPSSGLPQILSPSHQIPVQESHHP